MATEDSSNATRVPQMSRGAASGPARPPIVLDLPPEEAMALAQIVKRLVYGDVERLSSRNDVSAGRDDMLAGIRKLHRALAEAGFAPR